MGEILTRISDLWAPGGQGIISVFDILVVAFLTYRLLKLVQGRRAWTLLTGIAAFAVILFVSEKLQLKTLHWLLEKATILAPVALVILLLPELRAALEGFGRLGLWPEKLLAGSLSPQQETIQAVVQACTKMCQERTGALIVLQRSDGLEEVAKTGVQLRAKVSDDLLRTIFYEGSPMHDGAVLINEDEVVAGACRLPLSESARLETSYHMRHRAGLGLAEVTDAVIVIVSEERGQVSIAHKGFIAPLESPNELEAELFRLIAPHGEARRSVLRFRRKVEVEPDAPADKDQEPVK